MHFSAFAPVNNFYSCSFQPDLVEPHRKSFTSSAPLVSVFFMVFSYPILLLITNYAFASYGPLLGISGVF
jgi:hypothetical protein